MRSSSVICYIMSLHVYISVKQQLLNNLLTGVSQHQKGKLNILDFIKARDDAVAVATFALCTSLQSPDEYPSQHLNTQNLSRSGQPTMSRH